MILCVKCKKIMKKYNSRISIINNGYHWETDRYKCFKCKREVIKVNGCGHLFSNHAKYENEPSEKIIARLKRENNYSDIWIFGKLKTKD